jgi:hypothetical protein
MYHLRPLFILNRIHILLYTDCLLGHGYAKQHAAPAKHMLGAGLARVPS